MSIYVIHTIHAFTAATGGTVTCTYDLLRALNTQGSVQADVLVTAQQPQTGNGEAWIQVVPNDEKTSFAFSAHLRHALQQTHADIYHTNGLWRYCNHITASIARQKGKPYVITPHGMLYPQALTLSYWQKKILRWTLFNRDIRKAACIHVTCEQEMHHIRALGFTNPVAIIPNPVPSSILTQPVPKAERVTFGYLGRLHPRKHVERILDALALLTPEERNLCEVVIMGDGESNYMSFLHKHAAQLHLTNIRFMGFVEGIKKEKQLASLHALFVPSDFENFGMIVAEALRNGTPVFASAGTPWQILNEQGCGWWQAPTPDNMSAVMREVLTMPSKKLDEMGKIGQRLVAEQFSDQVVAQQMAKLYKWIVTKQNKPSFVYE